MTLQEAIEWQYKNISDTAVFISFGVMCFCIFVVFIANKDWLSIVRRTSICMLLEYLFLVFCSAILFRDTGEGPKYNFELFWSYKAIARGRIEYLYEDLLNIALMIPIGFLLSIIKPTRFWIVFISGIGISVLIEILQLVFHKGLCELDDVIHNAIGCMIGFAIYICVTKLIRRQAITT